MNTQDHTSPVRAITAWANSEDLPPQDLFDSVENYVKFVRNWKKLYREVTLTRRHRVLQARYAQATTRETLKKDYKNDARYAYLWEKLPVNVRPGRKEEVDAAAAKLRAEFPTPSPHVWHDPTDLIAIRHSGKRWVKAYHPWKLRVRQPAA